MSVYVDPLFETPHTARWRWSYACHMVADSLGELHRMATRLGLHRSWFQDNVLPHYGLTARRREAAVRCGAIELTRRELVECFVRPL